MAAGAIIIILCLYSSLVLVPVSTLQADKTVLNPPSFNLAEGRSVSLLYFVSWQLSTILSPLSSCAFQIVASSTCGEGVDGKEYYCKLVGAQWSAYDNEIKQIIQGQACDYCIPNDPKRSHKAEYAIDGTDRWWQSPPLSRGVKYNEVNLTIDLGQVSANA